MVFGGFSADAVASRVGCESAGPKIQLLSVSGVRRAVLEAGCTAACPYRPWGYRSILCRGFRRGVWSRPGTAIETALALTRRIPDRCLEDMHERLPPGVPRKTADADAKQVIVQTLEETLKRRCTGRQGGGYGELASLSGPSRSSAGVRPGPPPVPGIQSAD